MVATAEGVAAVSELAKPFVTKCDLEQLGALAGWPAVASDGRTLDGGETSWLRFVFASTPPDRRVIVGALAPWFHPELLATAAARERLRRWFTLGRPTRRRRVIDRDLSVMGATIHARRCLVAALAKLPAPVVQYVLGHVWVIAIRPDVDAGWFLQAPRYPVGQLQIITLVETSSSLADVFAHEVAHCWLEPVFESLTLRERARRSSFTKRLAESWKRDDLVADIVAGQRRSVAQRERRAAALVAAWGFAGPPADPDFAAAHALRSFDAAESATSTPRSRAGR